MLRLFRKRHVSQENLSEYLDNRLSDEDGRKVEMHLSACGECREDFESLRSTVELVQRTPLVKPRRSFVLAKAPATAPQRTGIPTWAAGLATSAALAAFLVILSSDLSGVLTTEGTAPRGTSPEAATSIGEPTATASPPQEGEPESTRSLMQAEASAGAEGEVSDFAPAAETPASTDEDASKEAIVEDRERDDLALTESAEPLGEPEGGTSAYWRIAEGVLAALTLVLVGGLIWLWRRAPGRTAS